MESFRKQVETISPLRFLESLTTICACRTALECDLGAFAYVSGDPNPMVVAGVVSVVFQMCVSAVKKCDFNAHPEFSTKPGHM